MSRLFTLFALLFATPAFAQLTVRVAATAPQTNWEGANEDPLAEIFDWNVGNEFALGYWFRLKNKRVEFNPSIYYGATSSDLGLDLKTIGAEFNVNIYPFDFGGDCDCPTWGKQGPQLEKGFFIQLTPGYTMYDLESPTVAFENSSGFTAGFGVGMDIGINNLVTLTPIARIRRGFGGFSGELLFTDVNGEPIGLSEPSLTTLQLSLQALFRFDHKRY